MGQVLTDIATKEKTMEKEEDNKEENPVQKGKKVCKNLVEVVHLTNGYVRNVGKNIARRILKMCEACMITAKLEGIISSLILIIAIINFYSNIYISLYLIVSLIFLFIMAFGEGLPGCYVPFLMSVLALFFPFLIFLYIFSKYEEYKQRNF